MRSFTKKTAVTAGAAAAAIAMLGFAVPASAAELTNDSYNDNSTKGYSYSYAPKTEIPVVVAPDLDVLGGDILSGGVLNGDIANGNEVGSGNTVEAPVASGNDTAVGSGNDTSIGNGSGNGNDLGNVSGNDVGAEVSDIVDNVTDVNVSDIVDSVTSDLVDVDGILGDVTSSLDLGSILGR